MDAKTVLCERIFRLDGTPYIWGGDDPTGFDCSGVMIDLLQSVGVLPRGFDATAEGLRKYPKFASVSAVEAKFGDLVYFGTTTGASHVGMYLGDGLMFEAGGGTSTTTSAAAAAKQNAFCRIRPVSWRTDRIGFNRPAYAPVPLAG